MAMIGCLGDIVFTVSSSAVETLDKFKWSGSASYSTHARLSANSLTEFTGLGPDKITFEMTLSVHLGVDPMDEVTKLWGYERSGQAVPLTVGNHAYGRYRWNIVSHTLTAKTFDRVGDLATATVAVTLQEYLKA